MRRREWRIKTVNQKPIIAIGLQPQANRKKMHHFHIVASDAVVRDYHRKYFGCVSWMLLHSIRNHWS
jgi:hypothetical protein